MSERDMPVDWKNSSKGDDTLHEIMILNSQCYQMNMTDKPSVMACPLNAARSVTTSSILAALSIHSLADAR